MCTDSASLRRKACSSAEDRHRDTKTQEPIPKRNGWRRVCPINGKRELEKIKKDAAEIFGQQDEFASLQITDCQSTTVENLSYTLRILFGAQSVWCGDVSAAVHTAQCSCSGVWQEALIDCGTAEALILFLLSDIHHNCWFKNNSNSVISYHAPVCAWPGHDTMHVGMIKTVWTSLGAPVVHTQVF